MYAYADARMPTHVHTIIMCKKLCMILLSCTAHVSFLNATEALANLADAILKANFGSTVSIIQWVREIQLSAALV